jgi:hypothetical protein
MDTWRMKGSDKKRREEIQNTELEFRIKIWRKGERCEAVK